MRLVLLFIGCFDMRSLLCFRSINRRFRSFILLLPFLLFGFFLSSESFASCTYILMFSDNSNPTPTQLGAYGTSATCQTELSNVLAGATAGTNPSGYCTLSSSSSSTCAPVGPPPCSLTGTASPVTITYAAGVAPASHSSQLPVYGNSSCVVNASQAKVVCVASTVVSGGQDCTYSGGTYANAPTSSAPGVTADNVTPSNLLPSTSSGTNGQPPASAADCAAGDGFAQINNMTGCLAPGSTKTNSTTQTACSGSSCSSSTDTSSAVVGGSTTNTYTDSNGNTFSQTSTAGSGGAAGAGSSSQPPMFDNTPLTFDSSNISATGNNGSVAFVNPQNFAVTAFIPGDAQGGCPFTDQTLTVMHTSATLPFSQWCQFTNWMYPFMTGLAYVGGFFILTNL